MWRKHSSQLFRKRSPLEATEEHGQTTGFIVFPKFFK